jgi:hypothetical protein
VALFGRGRAVNLPDGAETPFDSIPAGSSGTVRGHRTNLLGEDTYSVDVRSTWGTKRVRHVPQSALQGRGPFFLRQEGPTKDVGGYGGPAGSDLLGDGWTVGFGILMVILLLAGLVYGLCWLAGAWTWHASHHGSEPLTSRPDGTAWAGAGIFLWLVASRLAYSATRRILRPAAVLWRAPLIVTFSYLGWAAYFLLAPIMAHDPVTGFTATTFRWPQESSWTRLVRTTNVLPGCDSLTRDMSQSLLPAPGTAATTGTVWTYAQAHQPVSAIAVITLTYYPEASYRDAAGNAVTSHLRVEAAGIAEKAYDLHDIAVPSSVRQIRIGGHSGGGIALTPGSAADVQVLPHRWRILPGTPPALAHYLRTHRFHPETGNENPNNC